MPAARLPFSPANPKRCLGCTLAPAATQQRLVPAMHKTHIGNPDLIERHELHLRGYVSLLSKR